MQNLNVKVFVSSRFLAEDAPLDKSGKGITRKVTGMPHAETPDDLAKLPAALRTWHKGLSPAMRKALDLDKLTDLPKAVNAALRLLVQSAAREVIVEAHGAPSAQTPGRSVDDDTPLI